MAKQIETKNSFNGGEFAPSAAGRFDVAKYANAVKRMENFLPTLLGGASFRPGLRYVAETKDSNAMSHLIPFQFNTGLGYVMEFGSMYARFYSAGGQVIVRASDPVDTYTKFLSHFDGSNGQTSYTAESGQEISFFGDAQLYDALKVFGVSSIKFDGSVDYITLPDSDDWRLDDGANANKWTIDFRVRFNTDPGSGDMGFVQQRVSNSNLWLLMISGNQLQFKVESGGSTIVNIQNSWNPAAGVWYHVAVVKDGVTGYLMLIDGVQIGSTQTDVSTIPSFAGDLRIGSVINTSGSTKALNGWIDEFRISKGISRWTGNFTPPTSAYGGANAWVTSTNYAVGNMVTESGIVYICLVAHTSGTFATDLAANDWGTQSALEIATAYALADAPNIHVCQNADVMYLFHEKYKTQKLTRVSATEFTIIDAPFIRGPFLDANITSTTLTANAATGAGITVTASAAVFQAGHVGSLWRLKNAVFKIVTFTDTTHVVADVQAEPTGVAGNIGSTSALTDWAEGAFSAVRGYPRTGSFFGQRLVPGGTTFQPQRFFGSYLGAYDNFKIDASDASAAYIYEVSSEQVNAIKWITPSPYALQFGTSGGTISASVALGTITNVNPPQINADTNYGSLAIQPKRIASLLYYLQKNGFNLRELAYNYLAQRNFSNDMNMFAEHILRDGGGASDIDYQQSPLDRIWVVRNDGQVAVLLRNIEQEVMGWARILSGADSVGPGVIESLAVIQNESDDDEVWAIVKRTINGSTKRYVEYFTKEKVEEDWDKVLLDCSLTLDSPIVITGATKASPVVITAAGHGFSNGDQVRIDNVEGMTELNGNPYLIANVTTDTFELQSLSSVNVNGASYGTYVSGGEVRKMVTAISGLSHLEGETVCAQVDGDIPTTESYIVSGGAITLSAKAAVVHVGLKYTGTIQMLKLSGGTKALGTGQTQNKRIYHSTYRLEKSKRFKVGQDEDRLIEVAMPSSAGSDPFTGDVEKLFQNNWDKEAEPLIVQDKPLPLNVLAVFYRTETESIL